MTKKLVVDCSTGIVTEEEMTAEEIAQREADTLAWEAEQATRQAEVEAKAQARASALAKLKALGLSDEEIGAL
jgi:hypothetical protein